MEIRIAGMSMQKSRKSRHAGSISLPVYLPHAQLKDFLGLESGIISSYILLWVCGVGFLEFAVCCLGLAWRVRRTR